MHVSRIQYSFGYSAYIETIQVLETVETIRTGLKRFTTRIFNLCAKQDRPQITIHVDDECLQELERPKPTLDWIDDNGVPEIQEA